ncbi:MAG: NAD-dependent epimerase/dehydratase family protein [Rhodospirillaceae bacterium]|mgnify:FL=1|nr:NAD-dependent epimerase/dehydratase family protein [Rhodospirillaceae bacterium]MBT5563568.1 NAD-dependent epimerase/dehydratase family protein [Rhodospirillaceae bacterium]MBT7137707.1 NAD-dependent epimerase/dehydratase family protein [Rhodospirillaceae bacterium]
MTEFVKGKRFVVTGGAGFIGSHLVDALLNQGADHVTVVDNFFLGKDANLTSAREQHGDKVTVFREDAGDFEAMRAILGEARADVVFNLATKALLYSFFNPAGAARVNTDIAYTLADLLRAGAYGRLIQFSTSEVYGTAQTVPMTEEHPLMAETSYAAGKAAADLVLASYANMFGLDIGIIRPFNNYGPRQNDGNMAAIIPLTVRRICENRRPVIEGDGLQTRDFIFVRDTIEATLKLTALATLTGLIVNVGSGKETSIKEIIGSVCQEMEYSGTIEHKPARPADVRRHCADVGLMHSLIGEMVTTPLHDGIAQTVEPLTRGSIHP